MRDDGAGGIRNLHRAELRARRQRDGHTALEEATGADQEDIIALEKKNSLGEFHASLHEVEGGLFRAEYSGEINPDDPDEREIPDYHVGTSAADVKIWVEQMAAGLGYDRVVWDLLPSRDGGAASTG